MMMMVIIIMIVIIIIIIHQQYHLHCFHSFLRCFNNLKCPTLEAQYDRECSSVSWYALAGRKFWQFSKLQSFQLKLTGQKFPLLFQIMENERSEVSLNSRHHEMAKIRCYLAETTFVYECGGHTWRVTQNNSMPLRVREEISDVQLFSPLHYNSIILIKVSQFKFCTEED